MSYTILILSLLISFSAFSAEKVKVFWDCSLVDDPVSCVELKQAYFSNEALEDVPSSQGELHLIIRVLSLTNEVEYQVTTKWKEGDALLFPGFRLNSSLSAGERMEKVLVFLKDVTKPYISIANNGGGTEETDADKPYYLRPSLSGSANKQQGSTNINGTAEIMGNYSTQKWRLVGSTSGGMYYFNSNKTAFTPGITTQISYYGVNGGAIRSVKDLSAEKKGQWDVALFIKDKTVINDIKFDGDVGELPANSLHNMARKTSIRAGVEWIAIPFLTETSSGNIAVRYSLSAEHHKYVDPESYQYIQETFGRHLVEVYFARHYPKVDINAGIGAFTSTFRDKPLQGVTGGAEVKFKINPRMTLGAGGMVQYQKNQIMNPAENGMSFSGMTSGSTPLTYSGSLTLSYTLGSVRIFNKEQRWKD